MSEIIVRRARREDCKAVQKLSKELMKYEKLSDKPEMDDETFERDGFDGQPLYFCNVATCDEKIIGYAISHYNYASWCGKGMLLQDLYVSPDFRGKHVGSKLLKAVAKDAIENDCRKLDFLVLEWNSAQEFYKRHGAIDLSTKEPWHRYRILKNNLKKLASDCEYLCLYLFLIMSEIIIRKARREDCEAIRMFIQELADYEKMPDGPKIDYKTLERDGFDGQPLYLCNVATSDEKVIGYTLSYYTYSTWCGKSMYLEDIYVTPDFRRKHVGKKLLKAVAKEAIENDCHKLDFVVLKWNPAQEFYKMYRASDLTSKEQWHCYRFVEEDLKKLASDCE
ncbi:PREDICTED: uncharacterized protein LOC105143672 [Acromyrmex echinatior]|nr:PREDICTED: uncharacterized protein LOC105143672 [Acromyrmex echinatior]